MKGFFTAALSRLMRCNPSENGIEQAKASLASIEALLNARSYQAAQQKAQSDIERLSKSGVPATSLYSHFGLLGLACYSLKSMPEAIQAFTKAIDLAPCEVSSEYYANRAQILGETKRCDEALNDLSAALLYSQTQQAPFVAELYFRRALLFVLAGKNDRALEDVDRVLQLASVGSSVMGDAQRLRVTVQERLGNQHHTPMGSKTEPNADLARLNEHAARPVNVLPSQHRLMYSFKIDPEIMRKQRICSDEIGVHGGSNHIDNNMPNLLWLVEESVKAQAVFSVCDCWQGIRKIQIGPICHGTVMPYEAVFTRSLRFWLTDVYPADTPFVIKAFCIPKDDSDYVISNRLFATPKCRIGATDMIELEALMQLSEKENRNLLETISLVFESGVTGSPTLADCLLNSGTIDRTQLQKARELLPRLSQPALSETLSQSWRVNEKIPCSNCGATVNCGAGRDWYEPRFCQCGALLVRSVMRYLHSRLGCLTYVQRLKGRLKQCGIPITPRVHDAAMALFWLNPIAGCAATSHDEFHKELKKCERAIACMG